MTEPKADEELLIQRLFEEIEERCQTFDKDGNPIIHIDFKDSSGAWQEVRWWQALKQWL